MYTCVLVVDRCSSHLDQLHKLFGGTFRGDNAGRLRSPEENFSIFLEFLEGVQLWV